MEIHSSAIANLSLMRSSDKHLLAHTPIGATLARRLNQAEYQTAIRKLFGIADFELPNGFPADSEFHGFNNVGEGHIDSEWWLKN